MDFEYNLGSALNKAEIQKLYEDNMAQIAGMDLSSGSMIKGWIKGIERNGKCYVRLSNYQQHRVDYVLVDGDRHTLKAVAKSLGVILTDTHIEAYH